MEQTKALNALEPFLALHKSATSPAAAADLVSRATSAPNTYLFAELLHTPAIQSLSSSPAHASHLALLKIFSYGTYADYRSTPNLPPLNTQQTLKLRHLSLLTLARDRRNLTYEKLCAALDLASHGELESLVIGAVYAGLLDATLDPRRRAVQVHSVSALRDLAPGSVAPMMEGLAAWNARCEATLGDLEAEVEAIRARAARRQREKEEEDKEADRLARNRENSPETMTMGGSGRAAYRNNRQMAPGGGVLGRISQRFGKRGPADEGAEEAMDLDYEDDVGVKTRSSRRKL